MSITSLEPVAAGTDGGVSLSGTLVGLLGALLTSTVGWLAGILPLAAILSLSLMALLATMIESFAGATLGQAGLLDNDGINLLNTLFAALLGAVVAIAMA